MAAHSQITIPGFSAEQVKALATLIDNVVDKALDNRFGLLPPQQQVVTVPQPAQPSKQEQEHQPLQQATAENIAEKSTEVVSSSNVTTATTSLRSTVLHQATKQTCRKATFRLSNAPPLVTLTTTLTSLFASLHGYIHQAEDMEATGQG